MGLFERWVYEEEKGGEERKWRDAEEGLGQDKAGNCIQDKHLDTNCHCLISALEMEQLRLELTSPWDVNILGRSLTHYSITWPLQVFFYPVDILWLIC